MNENGRDREVAPTSAVYGCDRKGTMNQNGRDREVAPTAGFHFSRHEYQYLLIYS